MTQVKGKGDNWLKYAWRSCFLGDGGSSAAMKELVRWVRRLWLLRAVNENTRQCLGRGLWNRG